MCPVLRKYYLPPLASSEGIITAKPEHAPPASSSSEVGGRFFADPEPERGGSWLPGTVTPVLRFI